MRFSVFSVILAAALILTATVASSIAKEDSKDKDRGAFFGVMSGEITSEIADGYGVQPGNGILVEGVTDGSAAEKLGLRQNDIITKLDGVVITGPEEFRVQIKKHKPNDQVTVSYVRGGKEREGTATLTSRDDEDIMAWTPRPPKAPEAPRAFSFNWSDDNEKRGYAGLVLQNLSEGLAEYFKVEEGVLIAEVVEDSPADKAGLKAGDIIISVDGDEMSDENDVSRKIRRHDPGDEVDFVVKREGADRTIKVKLGNANDADDMGGLMWDVDGGSLSGLPALDMDLPLTDEKLRGLHEKLQDLKVEVDDGYLRDLEELRNLPPIQLELQPLPDAPGMKLEMRKARPIWDRTVWSESWDRVKEAFTDQMRTWEASLIKFREQMAQFRHELLQKFA